VVQRIQRFAQNNVVRRSILELIAQASVAGCRVKNRKQSIVGVVRGWEVHGLLGHGWESPLLFWRELAILRDGSLDPGP
jgi:hypothetical protein